MQDCSEMCPANDVTFQQFCELCENIINSKKNRSKQDNLLSDFITEFRMKAAQTPGEKKNCSFFPMLRLLLPKLDRQRPAYDMKEDKLGKLYVKILSLHSKSTDAQKLLNFRALGGSQHGSDFASIAFFVLQSRASRSGNLNIGQINQYLDKIATAEAGSKAQTNYEVITDVLVNTTPLQQKWWIRIILKDLKLEMGQKRIFSCFHPDAQDHYEHYQNLLKMCEELEDGDSRPAELGVQLYCAVSPMLSERLDVTELARLSPDKTYQIEAKFDGERFQMHMSDGVFGYYSRRGYSYTEQYGATYDSTGMLTPHLRGCFDPAVSSFILDGEMMGWHKERQCFSCKAMPFDVKKITANSKFRVCFRPFDLLYHNGRCLVGGGGSALPLAQRLQLQDSLFSDVPGVILQSKRHIIKEREEILTALNKAIEDDEEGVIVKEMDSFYIASKRNAGWYKVKPEYTDGVMVDLDLMIVGADYAESKRSGLAKSFFLALAVAPEVPGEMPGRWLSMGRVASGLSYEQRERLCEQLARHWRPLAQNPPPACLQFTKEKPELWIHPDHSCILQVKASELIRTTHYAAGYTLGFPRIMKVRDDKPLKDAMTMEEMERLVQGRSVERLTSRLVSAGELRPEVRARRRRPARAPLVAEPFRPAAASAAPAAREGEAGGALRGRKLCVLSGDDECSKEQLEAMIVEHGGVPVQNIGADTWCCVAGRLTQRARNALAARADVAAAAWLRALRPARARCPPPPPLSALGYGAATRALVARRYDRFGDSYEEDADEATLRLCFDKMEADGEETYLTTEETVALERELFGGASPFGCLRTCRVLAPPARIRLALLARALGAGTAAAEGDATHVVGDATHVVGDATHGVGDATHGVGDATHGVGDATHGVGDATHCVGEATHGVGAGGTAAAALRVSGRWLEECFEKRRLVDETPYLL